MSASAKQAILEHVRHWNAMDKDAWLALFADDVEYEEGEWVANAETGDMEWHAADGSVMSQAEWVQQLGGGAPPEADAAPAGEAGTAAAGDAEPTADAGEATEANVTSDANETTDGDGAPQ